VKIIVRHDREDTGWVAFVDGGFRSLHDGKIWKKIVECLIDVHMFAPWAEVFWDARTHHKMDNGYVFVTGDPKLKEVEFVNSPHKIK
jgi:hypothetical protein